MSLLLDSVLKVRISVPPMGKNNLLRQETLELIERDLSISEGFQRKLSLISAPAGYGKTTLVRTWLAGREDRCAWYSIDPEDNDTERFLVYLIAALSQVESGAGALSLEILSSLDLSGAAIESTSAILTPLLNDLFAVEKPLYLVLDDYHLIENTRLHEAMVFLIDNLPHNVHAVVITRSDPPWPLPRWRAGNSMAELRLENLRFSEKEAGQLIAAYPGINLNEKQLSALREKTEGWVAGLQMAAISLSSCKDTEEFIRSFTGTHRHLLHYLIDEVFAAQPENVRNFLMRTSVLDRFSASLCEAVTGEKESEEMIRRLERDNLFIVALDYHGEWFRYHHLFSELLSFQLDRKYPGTSSDLHAKASEWFLQAGDPAEAIRHSIAGGRISDVRKILEENLDLLILSQGSGKVYRCFTEIPSKELSESPYLLVYKAFLSFIYGKREDALEAVKFAEENPDVRDRDAFSGMLSTVKAYGHMINSMFPAALSEAETALEKLPDNALYWRMNASVISGDANLFAGKPLEAFEHYSRADESVLSKDNRVLRITTAMKMATSLQYRGMQAQAERIVRNSIKAAIEDNHSRLPRLGLLWGLLGEIHRERGELEEAERCVERGLALSVSERLSHAWNLLHSVAVSFSKNDMNRALDALSEIREIDLERKLPFYIMSLAAMWEARISYVQGNIENAVALLSEAGIGTVSDISKWVDLFQGVERGYLVLFRLQSSGSGDFSRIIEMLEEMINFADRHDYARIRIEALMVRALVEYRMENRDQAEKTLIAALEEGRKKGFLMMFRDEGENLKPILRNILKNTVGQNTDVRVISDYAGKILGSQERSMQTSVEKISGENTLNTEKSAAYGSIQKPKVSDDYPPLLEELSLRELEILELVGQGQSNEEIGKKLFISAGTVKWHVSNILGKLGVPNRTRAASVARKMGLIS